MELMVNPDIQVVSIIIGDRMDTGIIASIHAGIDTVLVLSGVTAREDLKKFAYHPGYVLPGVGSIPGHSFRLDRHKLS